MRLRPWRQWTLRSRMVVVVAALAAVALIAANVAGALLLRSYLLDRTDSQLRVGTHGPRFGGGTDFGFRRPMSIGPDVLFYVYNGSGQLVYSPADSAPDGDTYSGPTPKLGGWSTVKTKVDENPFTVNGTDGTPWRVIVTDAPQNNNTIVTAVSLHEVNQTVRSLVYIDLIVTALILLLMAITAAKVVKLGLRPLTDMEDMATEIAGSSDLSIRAAEDSHTEPGRLGMALNAMLVRIEGALDARTASEQRLRQFLADASHELRTPLTSIQGFAELYRRGGTPPGPELDEAMGRIESEVGRMRVLVNDLLLLARLDEERPLAQQPVDLLAVAAETVRDAHVRVPTRFVQLAAMEDAFDTFEPVTVLGDADRLRQVATNLISNAISHTPDDTQIVVRVGLSTVDQAAPAPAASIGRELAAGARVAVLEVDDSGPGIEGADAARVFERLYRADRSRRRGSGGGAGLGLAIVAANVTAHDGRVELVTAPGAGCRFRVLLPAVTEPDDELDDSELSPSFPQVDVEPLV